jgi:hypothetical protein
VPRPRNTRSLVGRASARAGRALRGFRPRFARTASGFALVPLRALTLR